jgi:hypothetical protein
MVIHLLLLILSSMTALVLQYHNHNPTQENTILWKSSRSSFSAMSKDLAEGKEKHFLYTR